MSKIPEFKEYLRMHLSFLANSAAAFDRGEMDEAIRMAVSIRVLFHDTGRSTSLLMQLGAKDIFLTSTCAPIPDGAFVIQETDVLFTTKNITSCYGQSGYGSLLWNCEIVGFTTRSNFRRVRLLVLVRLFGCVSP